ncbi:hypothetical protein ACQUFY_22550 [Robbsia andropogonis]|uniref:hypothetical protein n=1 Tax=Robbsia andropogonis TaxID=28092 RepID=UPI003D201103
MTGSPDPSLAASSTPTVAGRGDAEISISTDSARRISLILMSLAGLSQGFIGPIVKLVDFAPLPLVVGRCIVAAVLLHAICILTGRRVQKTDRINTIICGFLLAGHFAGSVAIRNEWCKNVYMYRTTYATKELNC